MEDSVKRIVCFVSAMNYGGAETFIMKIYRSVYKRNVSFDFITAEPGKYDDEITKLGGKIYIVPKKSSDFFGWFMASYSVLKKGNYDAALRMTSNSLGILDLIIAKFAGIKVLISRSTNANEDSKIHKILSNLFSFLPRHIPTCKIAPSIKAAEYLYGKSSVKLGKVKIVKNGIDLKKYLYKEDIRIDIRNKLGITNETILIGHIGRFSRQKNHKFIVKILKELKDVKYKMLFIGSGLEKEKIENDIFNNKLTNNVIFIESTTEVEKYMMSMDVLLLPSLYEGMPNVVVEAQATNLQSLVSNTVTREVDLTGLVSFLSINDGDEKLWAEKICSKLLKVERSKNKANMKMEALGYDINDVSNNFLQYVFGDELNAK